MPNKQLLQSAGDGTAVPVGYVGEVRLLSATLTVVTTNWVTSSALFVTKGIYMVNVFGSGTGNGGTRTTQSVGVSTDSTATTFSDQVAGVNTFQAAIGSDGRGTINGTTVINVLSDTNYYIKSLSFGANSTLATEHILRFTRIA